jgi:choline dehydrogenase
MRWDFFVNHYDDPVEAKKDSKLAWTTPTGYHVGKNPPAGATPKGVFYPRSSTLGGCTAHNAMVAVYPHAKDWQHIVDITGDKSWNPDALRKLWEGIERAEYVTINKTGHGVNGNLSVSLPPVTLAGDDARILTFGITTAQLISKDAVEEALNIGRVTEGDMNSADHTRDSAEGAWLIPLTVGHDQNGVGRRSGSRDLVLNALAATAVAKGPRFDLLLNTLVTKVNFEEGSGKPKAVGVEVLKGKKLYRADRDPAKTSGHGIKAVYKASKEVILAGGAFNTPQILKLSGIGPKEELTKFNIPIKVDLPGVGTNLQDHFEIGVTHKAKSPFDIVKTCTFGRGVDPCVEQWAKGQGAYGSTNGFVYGVIKRSSVAAQDVVYGNDPDLFLFGGVANFRGYYPGYAQDVYQHSDWTWVVLKAHTGNRAGTVKLTSADPRDPPAISFNYFDAKDGAGQRDLTAMAEAVDLARKITMNITIPGDDIGFAEITPGTDKPFPSKELEAHIRAESWSHHASCSCPIGSEKDLMAVLDSKFRVRGVDGLRVVDASSFPRIPGYFIAVPTYMLGEKAASSILSGDIN